MCICSSHKRKLPDNADVDGFCTADSCETACCRQQEKLHVPPRASSGHLWLNPSSGPHPSIPEQSGLNSACNKFIKTFVRTSHVHEPPLFESHHLLWSVGLKKAPRRLWCLLHCLQDVVSEQALKRSTLKNKVTCFNLSCTAPSAAVTRLCATSIAGQIAQCSKPYQIAVFCP